MKRVVLLLVFVLLLFPASAVWPCLDCSDIAGKWRGSWEGVDCPAADGGTESGLWVAEVMTDCSGIFYSAETGEILFVVEFCGDTFTGTGEDDPCGEVSISGTVNDDSLNGTYTYELGGGGTFEGRRVTDIPTLSSWGMAALGIMLVLAAVLLLRKRRINLERA